MDSRRLHAHAHQRGKAASKIRDFGISLSQPRRTLWPGCRHPHSNLMLREMAFCWRMNQKNEIRTRCEWARNELSIRYHDEEWGVPQHDDKKLFEFLILEGAQAGLSWDTILRKRENYRAAFDGFDPQRVARYDRRKITTLLKNDGIVRNRLKIAATIENAKMFLAVRKEFRSFDAYMWSFVGGKPIQNRWRTMAEVPARAAESDAMSRDLLRRGFKFVGSTICYALMQATGMVNDHLVTCPRRTELGGVQRRRRS